MSEMHCIGLQLQLRAACARDLMMRSAGQRSTNAKGTGMIETECAVYGLMMTTQSLETYRTSPSTADDRDRTRTNTQSGRQRPQPCRARPAVHATSSLCPPAPRRRPAAHSEQTIPVENWRARRVEARRGGGSVAGTGGGVGTCCCAGAGRIAVVAFVCCCFVVVVAVGYRLFAGGCCCRCCLVTVWQGHCSERLSTVRLRRPGAVASRRGRSSGQTAAACRRPPPLRWPRVAEQPRGMNQR